MLKSSWRYLFLLTLFVVFAYANSLSNEFIFDDIPAIVKNPNLGNLPKLVLNPLIHTNYFIYFIIYKLAGLNPAAFRLIGIFSHLGTVFGVYLLIYIMTKKLYLSFITASLFAVHPILTEPVTLISAAHYPRYSLFIIFSLIFYILSKSRPKLYFVSLFLYLFALNPGVAKAVIYPLILICYEACFGNIRKNWKRIIPFGLEAFIYIILVIIPYSPNQIQYFSQGQGIGAILRNPFIYLPFTITAYIEMVLWPRNLFPHFKQSVELLGFVIRSIIFIVLIIFYFFSFKKNKLVFFWVSFFLIGLLPTLTPLGVTSLIAERYVYLSSIGLFFIIALGLNKLYESKKYNTYFYIVFVGIILFLIVRTALDNIDFKNDLNFMIAAAKQYPNNHTIRHSLGMRYLEHNNSYAAKAEFEMVIAINPLYTQAYHNLGNIYVERKDISTAIKYYNQAIQTYREFWPSYLQLGNLYLQLGQLTLAEDNFQKVLKIMPSSAEAYMGLGDIYLKKNEKKQAMTAYKKSLKLNPKNKKAQTALANLK